MTRTMALLTRQYLFFITEIFCIYMNMDKEDYIYMLSPSVVLPNGTHGHSISAIGSIEMSKHLSHSFSLLCCTTWVWVTVIHVTKGSQGAGIGIANWPTLSGRPPLLFSHAGESSYLPRNTIGAFWLAAVQGADYVDTDVVLTKDGIPVCHHDATLKESTDVQFHPQYASLRGNHTVLVDGTKILVVDDWLIIHFTLEELKELRVAQVNKVPGSDYLQYVYPIPTFQEFLDTVHQAADQFGRPIGIIPELKAPSYHNQVIPRFMETTVLNMLHSNGYPLSFGDPPRCSYHGRPIECGPVILQSMERSTSYFFFTQLRFSNVGIMTVIWNDVIALTRRGWAELSAYSDYVAIWKELLCNTVEAEIRRTELTLPDRELVRAMGGFLRPEEFIPEAHRRKMGIGIYEIHSSKLDATGGCHFRYHCERNCEKEEMVGFFDMGVDALFVESTSAAVLTRANYNAGLNLLSCQGKQ